MVADMLIITFVNGARKQSCELMNQKDRLTSQRAVQSELSKVTPDTELLQVGDVQHIISIKGGKTGTIKLIIPKRLWDALLATSLIKWHVLGSQEKKDLLIVDRVRQLD